MARSGTKKDGRSAAPIRGALMVLCAVGAVAFPLVAGAQQVQENPPEINDDPSLRGFTLQPQRDRNSQPNNTQGPVDPEAPAPRIVRPSPTPSRQQSVAPPRVTVPDNAEVGQPVTGLDALRSDGAPDRGGGPQQQRRAPSSPSASAPAADTAPEAAVDDGPQPGFETRPPPVSPEARQAPGEGDAIPFNEWLGDGNSPPLFGWIALGAALLLVLVVGWLVLRLVRGRRKTVEDDAPWAAMVADDQEPEPLPVTAANELVEEQPRSQPEAQPEPRPEPAPAPEPEPAGDRGFQIVLDVAEDDGRPHFNFGEPEPASEAPANPEPVLPDLPSPDLPENAPAEADEGDVAIDPSRQFLLQPADDRPFSLADLEPREEAPSARGDLPVPEDDGLDDLPRPSFDMVDTPLRREPPSDGFIAAFADRPRQPPAPPPPPVAPAIVPPPEATGGEERIELQFVARRAETTLINAVVDYSLMVGNPGDKALSRVTVHGALIQARKDTPREQPAAEGPGALPRIHVFENIEPGAQDIMDGIFRLPLSAIEPIFHGKRVLFVPMAQFWVSYVRADGQLFAASLSYVVGEESLPRKDRVAPFRLDLGPRRLPMVGQRRIASG